MLEVALYGGSFNPFTLGHLNICEDIYKKLKIPVWLSACCNHLFNKHLLESSLRLEMLKKIEEKFSFIYVIDWEIKNNHNGSTYDLILNLKKDFPSIKFNIVIGMDNANCIKDWDQYEKLIEENQFIVFSRTGVKIQSDWFLQKNHLFFETNNNISSTMVRLLINEKKDFDHLVDTTTYNYIVKNKLYGFSN